MRATWIVVCALVASAACNGADDPARRRSSRSSGSAPSPVAVEVSREAEAAGKRAGVDVEAVARSAVTEVARRIDLPPTFVSIRIGSGSRKVVDATGLGGFTDPTTGDVILWVDVDRHDLGANLKTWIPPLLAHELHHSARIVEGPGYGKTLLQAIVTEGLADAFAEEVFPATPRPVWTEALNQKSTCRWWGRARSQSGRAYDHGMWFFGRGKVPLWTGYSIGAALVRRYLEAHPGKTAADLAGVPARAVVAGADFCGGRPAL